jgi:hypothetical protein
MLFVASLQCTELNHSTEYDDALNAPFELTPTFWKLYEAGLNTYIDMLNNPDDRAKLDMCDGIINRYTENGKQAVEVETILQLLDYIAHDMGIYITKFGNKLDDDAAMIVSALLANFVNLCVHIQTYTNTRSSAASALIDKDIFAMVSALSYLIAIEASYKPYIHLIQACNKAFPAIIDELTNGSNNHAAYIPLTHKMEQLTLAESLSPAALDLIHAAGTYFESDEAALIEDTIDDAITTAQAQDSHEAFLIFLDFAPSVAAKMSNYFTREQCMLLALLVEHIYGITTEIERLIVNQDKTAHERICMHASWLMRDVCAFAIRRDQIENPRFNQSWTYNVYTMLQHLYAGRTQAQTTA